MHFPGSKRSQFLGLICALGAPRASIQGFRRAPGEIQEALNAPGPTARGMNMSFQRVVCR